MNVGIADIPLEVLSPDEEARVMIMLVDEKGNEFLVAAKDVPAVYKRNPEVLGIEPVILVRCKKII